MHHYKLQKQICFVYNLHYRLFQLYHPHYSLSRHYSMEVLHKSLEAVLSERILFPSLDIFLLQLSLVSGLQVQSSTGQELIDGNIS